MLLIPSIRLAINLGLGSLGSLGANLIDFKDLAIDRAFSVEGIEIGNAFRDIVVPKEIILLALFLADLGSLFLIIKFIN